MSLKHSSLFSILEYLRRIVLTLLQMFGRIHHEATWSWSYLAGEFLMLLIFVAHYQSIQIFYLWFSLRRLYVSSNYPFFLCFPICWHIIVHKKSYDVLYFCDVISDFYFLFYWCGPSLPLDESGRSLSILFIFSSNSF